MLQPQSMFFRMVSACCNYGMCFFFRMTSPRYSCRVCIFRKTSLCYSCGVCLSGWHHNNLVTAVECAFSGWHHYVTAAECVFQDDISVLQLWNVCFLGWQHHVTAAEFVFQDNISMLQLWTVCVSGWCDHQVTALYPVHCASDCPPWAVGGYCEWAYLSHVCLSDTVSEHVCLMSVSLLRHS